MINITLPHAVGNATSGGFGYPGSGVEPWEGLDESCTVDRDEELHWATPVLPEGRYIFEITGGNDVDLYVRVGTAPTPSTFDCRPYSGSSNECCALRLDAAAAINVMVRGYAQTSTFELVGSVE